MKKTSTVVVIEDDHDTRDILCSVLTEAGFTVLAFVDYEPALWAIIENSPALILLDLNVPGARLSPHEFMKKVRGVRPETKLLVVSGSAAIAPVAHALGASGHVIKPFDLDTLLASVRTACPE